MTAKYAFGDFIGEIDESLECRWFWRAVLSEKSIDITLTEGGKKQQALLSRGRCAIAFTSIYTWRAGKGSKRVHPWAAIFAKDRTVHIAFDQDSKPKTVENVNYQAKALGNALMKSGAVKVNRLSWAGTAKGIDDFIHSQSSRYDNSYCDRLLDNCYKYAEHYLSFDTEEFFPGTTKTVNKRFLDIKDFAGAKLINVIKSAKGTGKTMVLSQIIHEFQRQGTPTLLLAHLEKLALELGARCGLPYRTDQNSEWLRNQLGYALCLDSFHEKNRVPFRVENWRNTVFAFDEYTQGFDHLAFGNTDIKNNRALVASNIAKQCINCLRDQKPMYLADADANVESLKLVYELIELYSGGQFTREYLESETFCLVNEYQPQKGTLYLYDERTPKVIRTVVKKSIEDDENLMLLSSTQKSSQGNGSKNIEKLATKSVSADRVLRIDSETTKNPEHPAYKITGNKISSHIQSGKCQVITASPSLSTGTSIDGCDSFFDKVFSLQKGNLPVNSVLQQLVRLRDFQVERHVFVPKTGNISRFSKSTNPKEILCTSKRKLQAAVGSLDPESAEAMLKSTLIPLDKYWAKRVAAQNKEAYNYRESFIEKAQRDGWNLVVLDCLNPDPSMGISSADYEKKEIIKMSLKEEYQGISEASELTDLSAKKINRSGNCTEIERYQLKKHEITQKYSLSDEDIIPEVAEADYKGAYKGLRLRFWLLYAREYLTAKDSAEIKKHKQKNEGMVFAPDLNRKLDLTKIQILEKFKIDRFLMQDREWNNKDLELKRFAKQVKEYSKDINSVLRCGISMDDSPIVVAQKLLKTIGYKLTYLRNERDGKKKRLRIYGAAESKFSALHQHEDKIFARWLEAEKRRFAPPTLCQTQNVEAC